MKLFDVYPLQNLNIVKAENCLLWDADGTEYLDFYGGHAVISVGHSHPKYVSAIKNQLDKIGFYSNSVINTLQEELADKLGKLSGYEDYNLFLCNSGAEANENALKLASFTTGKKKFITFSSSFHGRTSAAVAATDDTSIIAPVNETDNFIFCKFNDNDDFKNAFEKHRHELAGVIIEGIQGIGGICLPEQEFMETIARLCEESGIFFICDEIQSGYGRSGKFFAHQYYGVRPDILTVAKGMANGFPAGGVLIIPNIAAKHKMLGTTFGGNHLACAAGIAVLDIIKDEGLTQNAATIGEFLISEIKKIKAVKEVRGKGLMIGLDFDGPAAEVSKRLRETHRILVGSASKPNTMRLLPPLTVSRAQAEKFVEALKQSV